VAGCGRDQPAWRVGWRAKLLRLAAIWLTIRRCWGQASFQGDCLLRRRRVFSWIRESKRTRQPQPRQFRKVYWTRDSWPRPPRPDCCGAAPWLLFENGANEAIRWTFAFGARPDPWVFLAPPPTQCRRAGDLVCFKFLQARGQAVGALPRLPFSTWASWAIGEEGTESGRTLNLAWSLRPKRLGGSAEGVLLGTLIRGAGRRWIGG